MTEFSDETIRKGTADWFNREGPFNTTLEELTRYATAVASAPLSAVSHWLTPRCPECGLSIKEMGVDKDVHLIMLGNVLVGCEWFWVVNPNAVGIAMPNWDDWTESYGDLELWKETGRPGKPIAEKPPCTYLSPGGTPCRLRQDGHWHE